MHRHHARVVELGGDLGLRQEAREQGVVALAGALDQVRSQLLDRHRAAQRVLERLLHDPLSAAAERLAELEAPLEVAARERLHQAAQGRVARALAGLDPAAHARQRLHPRLQEAQLAGQLGVAPAEDLEPFRAASSGTAGALPQVLEEDLFGPGRAVGVARASLVPLVP